MLRSCYYDIYLYGTPLAGYVAVTMSDICYVAVTMSDICTGPPNLFCLLGLLRYNGFQTTCTI